MPVTSNIDEILAVLRRLPDALDFRRDGLADQVFDVTAIAIHDRFIQEVGTEGRFADNQGRYGEAKRERGVPVGIGLHGEKIGGEMSQEHHFLGMREIEADEALLMFGIDDSNRRKGMWFSEGNDPEDGLERSGAANQPPRRFFALLEPDIDAAIEIVSDHVDRFMESL